MNLKSVFAKLGGAFKAVYKVIDDLVPDEKLVETIRLVEIAAGKFVDNTQRREWAVSKTQTTLHVPEYIARLLVELAVASIKNGIGKIEDKAEEAVTK